MRIVQVMKQTCHISMLCSKFFREHPSLLLFPCGAFILYFLLEVGILLFIYSRYGIHFFNPQTFELWGLFLLWDIGIFLIVSLGPLYCLITFFLLMSKACVSYALITFLGDASKFSFKDSLRYGFNNHYEFLKFAYLKTILVIVGESSIKNFLRKQVDSLGGKDYIFQSKERNWLEASFLVVPLLVAEKMSLQKSIRMSKDLMHKTFGEGIVANFSFVLIMFLLILGIAVPVGQLVNLKYNGMLGIASFFLLLGFIVALVRSIEAVFHAVVYNYCMKKPLGYFTEQDVITSFAVHHDDVA